MSAFDRAEAEAALVQAERVWDHVVGGPPGGLCASLRAALAEIDRLTPDLGPHHVEVGWTPSTQQVRSHYVFDQSDQWSAERGAAFDRWLSGLVTSSSDVDAREVYVIQDEMGDVIDVTTSQEWAEHQTRDGADNPIRTLHKDTLWDGPADRGDW